MKRNLVLAFLALATSPLAAHAADLDYSYLEAGYSRFDPDNGANADGWALGGSAAITGNLHVFGSYSENKVDHSNLEANPWRLGLGWNQSISERSDVVVRGNYVEYSVPGPDLDGWEAEVGLRSALSPNFETYIALGYGKLHLSGFGSEGDLYGKVGAQYKFNPSWGIAASATLTDSANEYFIGPRLSF